ncbi:MAG: hypothetical protein ATN35_06135 [Epulopiscium sp. Nele67-Bin004]|nr:MAG: hypothetical protein ATN35_06135 [Epulopiscium sp. Nele67-Bin004]
MSNNKGYTLIELMVVVTIIWFVGTISTVQVNYVNRMEFKIIKNSIYDAICEARETALRTGNDVYIKNEDNTLIIGLSSTLSSYQEIQMPNEVTLYVGNKDMTYTDILKFNGETISPSSAGTVTITNDRTGEQVQITITPVTGNITMYD